MRKKIQFLKKATAITLAATMVVPSSFTVAKGEEQETKSASTDTLKLWYAQPASEGKNILSAGSFGTTAEDNTWQQQTLPIGNSYMGANIYGEVEEEHLTFNQKTLWNGGPSESRSDYNGGNIETASNGMKMSDLFKSAQQSYLDGNDDEGSSLASYLVGKYDGYGAYQSFGDIYVDFGFERASAENYTRDLDINNAISHVDFDYNGTKMSREYFISYPDNVLAMKFTADGDEELNINVRFPVDNAENVQDKNLGKEVTTTVDQNSLTVAGEMQDNQMKLNGQIVVASTDGTVTEGEDKESLDVTGAKEIIMLVSADTDYMNSYPDYRTGETAQELNDSVKEVLNQAVEKGYDAIKADHVADYQEIFHRVELDLGQEATDLATDQLLNAYVSGNASVSQKRLLEVLLFQYGRYLQIASSRAGDLPANLQGVWQNRVGDANRVPWGSDYHMNVNLQMNYWPTYVTNMAECGLPLIDYINSLVEPGRETAKTYFGVTEGGFTAHTQNTPFGWTCPGWNFSWGWSPAALPWILQNCWEYYEYTEDLDYMRDHIYPILKESAILYDQILIEKDGRLVSAPAYSPEHGPISAGNTYEQSLIWQLYEDTIKAAELLGVDAEKVASWKERQSKLNPIEIGDSGQIKEWYNETTLGSIGERQHRHMSHLLGLYPGDLINVDNTQYMDAAIVSLKERGDVSTGWGMGQRINAWARTGDGNHAYQLIQTLFKSGIYPNLWDSHAPFQIDGNFGMTSGVAEMLLQSNVGYINILPALPDEWSSGSYSGLVARGNFEVSTTWDNNAATEIRITSKNGNEAIVQTDNISFGIVLDENGNPVDFDVISKDRISFATEKGKTYVIQQIPASVIIPAPSNGLAECIQDGQVEISWNAVEGDGISYRVYRQIDKGDLVCIADGITETSYTDQTMYDFLGEAIYQIVAVKDGKEGKYSEAIAINDLRNMAGYIDDQDSRVVYTGSWGNYNVDANNYNGTIKYLENPVGGETAQLTFVGTGIEVISAVSKDRGYLDVTIDGEAKGQINTYSSTYKQQQKVFEYNELPYGKHTVVLTATGTHDPSATKAKVELDAFIVKNDSVEFPESITVTSASGITTVTKPNTVLQMKAEIVPAEADQDQVEWSVNDTSLAEIDQNGRLTIKEANGTVTVRATSTIDSSIQGSAQISIAILNGVSERIVEDAVNDGTWKLNPAITWSSGWSTWAGEPDKHHGETKTENNTTDSWFEYSFEGIGIEIYVQKHANFGAYEIFLDGTSQGIYSMEGSSDGDPQALLAEFKDLADGEHTIKCVAKARENRTQVNFDYLKVIMSASESSVDKTALQDKILEEAEKEESGYTEESWAVFKEAYESAVSVMNNPDVTDEEVNNAIQNLETAANALVAVEGSAPDVTDAKVSVAGMETTTFVLHWSGVKYANSYDIYQDGVKIGTTTESWYRVKDLNPGTTYTFTICAVGAGGETNLPEQEVTTNATAETEELAPVQNAAAEQQEQSLIITWDANEKAAGYYVYVNGTKYDVKQENNYVITDIVPGTWYAIRITAYAADKTESTPAILNYYVDKAEGVDKSALEAAINSYSAYVEIDYTAESWKPFADALANAKTVLANEAATQEDVDAAEEALINAAKGLIKVEKPTDTVNKNALKTMIEKVEELNEKDYSTASWKTLQDSLDAAKGILADENATQAMVDQAYINLVTAWKNLEVGLNTSAADVVIKEAEEVLANPDISEYRPSSVQAVRDSLDAVKAALANPETTQEQLNDAVTQLIDALIQLKGMVNADALQCLINIAEKLLQNKDYYTTDTVKALEEALAAAKEVVANEDRTQQQIDDAYKNLADAIAGLVLRGNKCVLKPLIEKAEKILANANKYASKSLEGLEEALTAAKEVYEDIDAVQTEINIAAVKLAIELSQVRILGDVNNDCKIDTADAVEVLKASIELIELSKTDQDAADVNPDGIVNTADAALIEQYAAELISGF